ncbi:prolyl oligopeptidase family serine peptidase [soil metagenome]
MPRSLLSAFLSIVGTTALTFSMVATAAPPLAPSHPVTDLLHGVSVADPYRNLENVKDPETQAWLKAAGDDAAATLARIEGRDAIAQRIEALARSTGDVVREVTRLPGNRIYYLKRAVGQNQPKLMMRIGEQGAEKVLVDTEPLTRSTGVPHAINYFAPSLDGKTLAYGMSAGGSEDASLYLLDIASGKHIGQPVARVWSAPHWRGDSRAITYNQVRALPPGTPDTETYLDTTVFLLALGEPAAKARPLFGPLVDPEMKLQRLDVAEVMFAPGSRYMIARTTDTTVPEGKLFVAPVKSLGHKRGAWRQISGFDDKITAVELRGDTLYLRTYAGAPRGRLLALPLGKLGATQEPALAQASALAQAVEVVPEPTSGVLKEFVLGRDAIFAEVQEGFNTRVRRYGPGTPPQGVDVAKDRAGSTFAVADPAHAHADVWLVTSAWTEPPRVLVAAADGTVRDPRLRNSAQQAGMPELEVSEVLVPSHDGVKVPLAIIHRKGLVLDGNNPTLLDGYGAYGISAEAFFDPRSIAWLERGGVLAYANVRGSGAFGDAWHRAGFKASKPNTWKDGLACARYLIDQRYASAKTMGIWGTSAGGIFVGRAVTEAPELFAAAIFDVGIMDAVRAEESANGITNISEFGTAKDPAEFAALLAMSTYHQIKDGTAYPAVMLIHGLNDPRVDVWHSAKTAARLMAATSSGKPILLRLDGQAGHGVGSTAQQGYSKLADIYSFLLWQFGALPSKP